MTSPLILVAGNGSCRDTIVQELKTQNYAVKVLTDIKNYRPNEPLLNARRWISTNSLRRLEGQNVKVIVAIGDFYYGEEWMNAVRVTFERHSNSVAAVVPKDSAGLLDRLDGVFQFGSERKIEIALPFEDDGSLRRMIEGLKPFEIKADAFDKKKTTAWSREKVLLFGRTGAGKSTIAQMLTHGRLDSSSNAMFEAINCAKGVTKRIKRGEGRGWHVVDTPGFGERKGGTVTTKDAMKIVKEFVTSIGGIYSHFIYVVKKDRISVYDERLWTFFTKVFKGAENNFSVVVTGCTIELANEDMKKLKDTFKGCKGIIPVDFCPIDERDPEQEAENVEVREESLGKLEEGLARLEVAEKHCLEGANSDESTSFTRSKLGSFLKVSGGGVLGDWVLDRIVSASQHLYFKPVAKVRAYYHKSEIDEHFILLPQ